MRLTGKALQNFTKWIYLKNDSYNVWVSKTTSIPLDDLDDIFLNALIIDWFDSAGINILLTCEFDFDYEIVENRYGIIEEVKKWYETRDEATYAAIKKANEIYNKTSRL